MEHMCAVTTANDAFCWGNNSYGQLGDSGLTQSYYQWEATRVSGDHQFNSISVGGNHTCALTVGGAAYCWGQGVLGSGTGYKNLQSTPLPVAGGLTFRSIVAGGGYTCGIRVDSVAVCWGRNTQGVLGLGSTTPTSSDTPMVVNTGVRFTAIAAGGSTACGLGSDSIAYCWGSNESNQVGSGPDVCPSDPAYGGCAFRPTAVPDAPRFRAVQISLSGDTACGITPSDDVFCWGTNWFGQFGDGTAGVSSNPVLPAASGLKLAAIDLGTQFACGSIPSGTVYCWGIHYGPVPVRLPVQP
jgi:alpha-tubulin suppressor-like RCC1 family protein